MNENDDKKINMTYELLSNLRDENSTASSVKSVTAQIMNQFIPC